MRVIVVDDEQPARQRLLDLLAHESDVDIAGAFGDPEEAVALLSEGDAADLVFLDIEMPGMSGVDVVREVGAEMMPLVIFVTAFDRYAVDAFELSAIDYLLKPYDDTRFREALTRAREQLRLRELGQLARLLATYPKQRAKRIAVREGEKTVFVPVEQIDYIQADGPYAEIHAAGKRHLLRERMHVLEAQLDANEFVRIHRSTIVRLDRIVSVEPYFQGELIAKLKDGTSLHVSRGKRNEVEKKLGM